jgi:hypothetical protein
MIPAQFIADNFSIGTEKNPDTWHEVLLVDDDLLPAGRMYERYVYSKDKKAVELRVYARPDTDPNAEPVFEGWFDGGNICLSNDKQSCIDFLVDWAGKTNRSW